MTIIKMESKSTLSSVMHIKQYAIVENISERMW